MQTLTAPVQFEDTIKGSRFLSELLPCTSQVQAREFLRAQKAKYADATHVVHAFVVGSGAEVMGMSDDGEPGGTAGRPVLDVLRGRGCTNVILTVTRWFGGTLLGTGGLVKAYSGGAKGVIAAADEAGAFEELVEKSDFTFSCDYALYQGVKKLLELFSVSEVTEDFGSEITVSGKIRADEKNVFIGKIRDVSNGKVMVK